MIIDIHTHITPSADASLFKAMNRKRFSAGALVRTMDREGIDKSVVLPLSNPENQDIHMVAGNLETIRQCKKFPDRLIPFYNLDPRGMLCSPNANLAALIRAFKDMGCVGIGEICANMPVTHPLYRNLFHHAAREKMPLLFHFAHKRYGVYGARDSIHLPGLEQMLQKFPDAVFIGHGQTFWAEISGEVDPRTRGEYPKTPIKEKGRLWKLLKKYPNLYGDISAGSGYNALTRTPDIGFEFLETFSEKLFFGTDRFMPGLPRPPIIDLMKTARHNKKITNKAFDNIMSGNFKRVVKHGG